VKLELTEQLDNKSDMVRNVEFEMSKDMAILREKSIAQEKIIEEMNE
jgi:hypothetical protein